MTVGPSRELPPEQAGSVLVVNTGFSSLKLRVLDPAEDLEIGRQTRRALRTAPHAP